MVTQHSTVKWLKVFGILAALALLLAVPALFSGRDPVPAAAAPPEVGVSLIGQNALELIGRIDQDGANFTGYGYLTYIRDLNNSQLFTNPGAPSETTARFTFYATSNMTSRAILSDVFVIDSLGTLTFYFDETPSGRSFNNPTSFTGGAPIATASIRFHDTLLVQGPNRGLASGVAEASQQTATPFTLGGTGYTLGEPGLFYKFVTIGNATRTEPTIPRSFVLLSGYAVTGGQTNFLPVIHRDSP